MTERADHPGVCATENCLKRLVALAKLIDPTYRETPNRSMPLDAAKG